MQDYAADSVGYLLASSTEHLEVLYTS